MLVTSNRCLWDATTGRKIRSLEEKEGHRCDTVAFTADGKTLITTDGHLGISVRDVSTGKLKAQFNSKKADDLRFNSPLPFLLSSDGVTAAFWDQMREEKEENGGFVVWDVLANRERFRRPKVGWPCAFSHDGKRLAFLSKGAVLLVDALSGKDVAAIPTGDAYTLALSPDGRTLATTQFDGIIRLWDVPAGKELPRLPEHQTAVRNVSFLGAGKSLATVCVDETVHLWDTATGRHLSTIPKELHSFLRRGLASTAGRVVSPDGTLVAVTDFKNTIRLLDARTGEEVRKIIDEAVGKPRAISAIAFSPDGRVLASGGGAFWSPGLGAGPVPENGVRRFDVATGRPLSKIVSEPQLAGYYRVNSLAFSPDGRFLAINEFGVVSLREAATGARLAFLYEVGNTVLHLEFSPDGERMATALHDGSALVWDCKPLAWKPPMQNPTSDEVVVG